MTIGASCVAAQIPDSSAVPAARFALLLPTPPPPVWQTVTLYAGPPRRKPVLAAPFGFIVPGAGHLYAGEVLRGLLVMGVPGGILMLGGWGVSVVDGALAASRFNRAHSASHAVAVKR